MRTVWMKTARFSGLLEKPIMASSLFCGALVLWHVPAIYRWATAEELRHALMHLSFLGSGILFWFVVLEPVRPRRQNHAARVFFLFAAALITGLPGVIITLARQPLYVRPINPAVPFRLNVMATAKTV